MKVRSLVVAAVAALCAAAGSANAQFSINMNYTVAPTPSQQAIFNQAAANWEAVITGYAPGISLTGVTINVAVPNIDGAGGVLGNAGWNTLAFQGGYWLTTTGAMNLDAADIANMESGGTLELVIMHEIGHILGVGTLWGFNGLQNGSGNYIGAYGLAAYQTEYNQPGAAFIPVEQGGGPGTAGAHWDEPDGGGAGGPTSNVTGQQMYLELMTGWANPGSQMSYMTAQSMRDLGYTVSNTIPTPGVAAALGLGGLALGRRRRA